MSGQVVLELNTTTPTTATKPGESEAPPMETKNTPGGIAVTPGEKPPAEAEADPSKMTPEQVLKAYNELRGEVSKRGFGKEKEGEAAKPEAKPEGEKTAEEKAVEATNAAKEAYDKSVDAEYIKAAGGEAEAAKMADWSRANLTKESGEALDAALDSGNPQLARLAILTLKAAFDKATKEPTPIKGAAAQKAGGVAPFGDSSEMTAAMRDPRYATSESYRKEVAARIAISSF